MDIFDGRYYKTSKWFLEFLGLWPFQSNRKRYVASFIFFSMTGTVVLPQVLLLIELKTSNFNILIENSLSIIFGFACLLKYGVTFASRTRLQTLLTQIAWDWQRLTDKTEIDILSKYGEEGRFLVLFYTVYVFLAWVMFNFLPFIPPLLDILIPLENGTHDLVYPFYADYVFFKQTDYHYESCLHVFFVYFGTTSLFAGMDTIYVATVKHSCGLFAITCHRLETMARTAKSNKSNYRIKPNSVVHHDMVEAIVLHNETIRCVELLEDSFSLCFLMVQCMVVVGLATLCFYMMRIYKQTFNMCRFSTFTLGLVIHLLYLNWVGQQIIDSSDKVFYSTYYSDWYLISTHERQLTKIILARSLYPCQLTAGKISVLSMETFGALTIMEIFDSRYYKSCKVLMETLGLWPYQTQKRRRLSCMIFYLLYGSLLLPQVILLTQTNNFNIIVENTISILFLFVCVAKYAVSYASGPNFDLLFTQIAADWQNITDKSEREILSKYANEGRFASLFYTFYVFWAWATYNMMPFLPPILDIVLPLPNGSHPLLLPFYANYIFFEQLDYHYETALHAFFVYFFATSLFAGIDTIYVSTVKHTCGLFAIICYRLETLAKTDKNKASIELRSDKVVHRDLKNTIIMHNDTIRSCTLLEDSFSLCFLLIQSLCVVTIALGGFYILCIYNDAYKCLRVVAFYTGTVLHLLYLHYVGQKIIDSSEKIFNSAYSSEWYLISTNARKLTKGIMVRSLYPCHLTAGKITSLSMETFGSLMKTSMSYFTVLLSLE